MPTIKLSQETKQALDNLMAKQLKQKIKKTKGKEKQELFLNMIRSKYGITYDSFIQELIRQYTQFTK